MTDITALEGRITAALDRIGAGIAQHDAAPAVQQPDPELEGKLALAESEIAGLKEHNAALVAQCNTLTEDTVALTARNEALEAQAAEQAGKLAEAAAQIASLSTQEPPAAPAVDDSRIAALEERLRSQKTMMAKLDARLQRLQHANVQMRAVNEELRGVVTGGATPDLMDKALVAEVDSLQAQRAADAAEVDLILSTLKPLLEEATDATA